MQLGVSSVLESVQTAIVTLRGRLIQRENDPLIKRSKKSQQSPSTEVVKAVFHLRRKVSCHRVNHATKYHCYWSAALCELRSTYSHPSCTESDFEGVHIHPCLCPPQSHLCRGHCCEHVTSLYLPPITYGFDVLLGSEARCLPKSCISLASCYRGFLHKGRGHGGLLASTNGSLIAYISCLLHRI